MPAKKPARTPARRSTPKPKEPSAEQIAARAYFLWLENPAANADPVANWLRAEEELRAKPAPRRSRTRRSPS